MFSKLHMTEIKLIASCLIVRNLFILRLGIVVCILYYFLPLSISMTLQDFAKYGEVKV